MAIFKHRITGNARRVGVCLVNVSGRCSKLLLIWHSQASKPPTIYTLISTQSRVFQPKWILTSCGLQSHTFLYVSCCSTIKYHYVPSFRSAEEVPRFYRIDSQTLASLKAKLGRVSDKNNDVASLLTQNECLLTR